MSAVLSSLTEIPSIAPSPEVQPDSSRFDESAVSERSQLLGSRRGSREVPQKSGRLAGMMGFASGVGALLAGEFFLRNISPLSHSLIPFIRSVWIPTTSSSSRKIRFYFRGIRFSRSSRKRTSSLVLLRRGTFPNRSYFRPLRSTGQIDSTTRDRSTG